jgi:hypothetical protein
VAGLAGGAANRTHYSCLRDPRRDFPPDKRLSTAHAFFFDHFITKTEDLNSIN